MTLLSYSMIVSLLFPLITTLSRESTLSCIESSAKEKSLILDVPPLALMTKVSAPASP